QLGARRVERLGDGRAGGLEARRAVGVDLDRPRLDERAGAQRPARAHVAEQRRRDRLRGGHRAAAGATAGSRLAPTAAPPGQFAHGTVRRGFSIPTADSAPPSATNPPVTSMAMRKAWTDASSSAVAARGEACGGSG